MTDVLRLLLLAQIEDLYQISVKYDTTTSGAACWLADPDVAFTIDAELGVFFLENLEQLVGLSEQRIGLAQLGDRLLSLLGLFVLLLLEVSIVLRVLVRVLIRLLVFLLCFLLAGLRLGILFLGLRSIMFHVVLSNPVAMLLVR